MNLKLVQTERVAANYVKETQQRVEEKIRRQLKELIPSLVHSAHIISGPASSGSMTPEEAFNELKSQLKSNLSKNMRDSLYYGKQDTVQNQEILEMTSERSESSSSYLETDSAENSKGTGSSEERKRRSNRAPKIVVKKDKTFDGHASTIQIGGYSLLQKPSLAIQTKGTSILLEEKSSKEGSLSSKKPSGKGSSIGRMSQGGKAASIFKQTQSTSLIMTESFKPSVSFQSRSSSQGSSVVEASGLRGLEKALLKRKTVPVEQDVRMF